MRVGTDVFVNGLKRCGFALVLMLVACWYCKFNPEKTELKKKQKENIDKGG